MADTIEKKRKKSPSIKEHVHYHVNAGNLTDYGTPARAAAEGTLDGMENPDCGKAAPRRLDVHSPQPAQEVAAGHSSLTASRGFMDEMANIHSVQMNQTIFTGQSGFHGEFHSTDAPYGSPGNSANVQELPLRELGGTGQVSQVGSEPRRTTGYRNAQNSAVNSNGGHDYSSQYGATSRDPVSSKAAALQAIKNEMHAKGYVR